MQLEVGKKMLKSVQLQRNPKMFMLFLTFLSVFVHTTYGQAYYLSLSHISQPNNFFAGENTREPTLNLLPTQLKPNNHTREIYKQFVDKNFENEETNTDNNNSDNKTTIIVYKNLPRSAQLSQTAMDIITIVWYVATFLALAAFFLLMACSDRRCEDARSARNGNTNEVQIAPPTPSPSYSEFAPPSYETVIKMQNDSKTSIFVIPFTMEGQITMDKDNNNNSDNSGNVAASPTTPNTPAINFYTINELQKLGS